MSNKYKPGELTEYVLETIANQLIAAGGYYKPRLNVVIGELIKAFLAYRKEKIDEAKIRRTLENLEKKEILFIEERDNKVFVSLRDKGKEVIKKYSVKVLLDYKKKEKKWTRKWFLVFFDVPEIQRNKRDYLRKYLLKIGFYPYQKSVYLFPYECEEEINLIQQIVEGAKYMKYIIADKIEDESQAKIFFDLV